MSELSLADAVFSKLAQQPDFVSAEQDFGIDAKVADVFEKVGLVLSRYKSGKIPKAFKVVPTLRNWQEILELTAPQKWTPNAMFEATKIFSSNLPPKTVETFYRDYLLQGIRRNFDETKNVNVHYYQALKKAIYKPAAFFKGIIFPLLQDENTTLKEASIYCSVVSKVSFPCLHAAAALVKLCAGPYSGPKFMMIRALIEKKFALPTKAVYCVFDYFLSFENGAKMPVIWQQALISLVQRYKLEFDQARRDALRSLVEKQSHEMISPEILREIEEC